MPAEEMGKVTDRMRFVFAVTSLIFLAVLAISPIKDYRREWKQYKRSYWRFAQGRADTKRLTADYSPNIDQIWLPGMNVVDRCTTCHQGVSKPLFGVSLASDYPELGATASTAQPSGAR